MKDTSNIYEHKGHSLRGWFNDNKRKWYTEKAKNIKDGVIIEIGVFGGVSILSIADICIKNNTKIYGIDPWELLSLYNERPMKDNELKNYRETMKGHRLNLERIIEAQKYEHIELIKGFSVQEANKFEDKSVDLVYIDANHSYDSTLADINAWYPKLKKGGILSGDDFTWSGVKKAVCEFCNEHNFKFKSTNDSWEVQL